MYILCHEKYFYASKIVVLKVYFEIKTLKNWCVIVLLIVYTVAIKFLINFIALIFLKD